MPAPLKFRQSVTTKPTTTEVKNSPLSNIEIDGNMHSLQDAISAIEADNWVTTNRVLDSNITPSKLSSDGLGFRYKIGIYSDNSNTASTVITKGTTAQRDISPQEGFFRYNTTIGRIEWRNATDWVSSLKTNDTINIGTTSVSLDRASGALTLNGVTVDNSTNIAVTNDAATNATYYPVFSTATSGNTPVKVSSTKLTYNPSTGTLTSTYFVGDGSGLTNIPATNLSITNDTSTNTIYYPVFSVSSSGNSTIKASSSKLQYNPSTGTLTATKFVGDGISLTNLQLSNTTGTLPVSKGGTGVTTLTGIVKASGTNAFVAATAGTDYQAPIIATGVLKGNGSGTVVAATAGTDYLTPTMSDIAVSGFKTATFNGQNLIATTTGAITIDWTVAQNQKQTEPTGSITYTFTAPPGVCHLQLLIDSDGTSTAQTIVWPASVIWMGNTWSGMNNKKSIINFWYDGTNYYAMGTNQV